MGRQVTRLALGDRRVRGRGRRWWLAALVTTCVALAGGAGVVDADDAFRCGLIESGGVAEQDARTAADLVCQELRRSSGGRGAFEVQLASLGRIVFVTASRTEPPATVTVRVDTLEEIPVAAPRLAEALVGGEPLVATQRVDNLLGAEARPLVSKKGSLKFLVGVADVESPGHGARAAGLTVGILYAAPRFALPAELRLAWDDAAYPDPELDLFSVSVGGRGYLSTRNTSPFAGGGIGVLRLHAREGAYPGSPDASSSYFDGDRFGVAPYLEAGVETLRLHRARVALLVRVDLPLQSLETPEIPTYSYPDGWDREPVVSSVLAAQSRYVVPVSIGVSVAF